MSVRSVMAAAFRSELSLRGVSSLTRGDCEEIVERLIERLSALELKLAAPEVITPRRP